MRNKSTNKPDRIAKVQSFLTDGIYDYIAARVLFLSQLPQQASILSSTAIEKLFKAIIAFNGNESQGHLKKAHWNAIRNFDRNLFAMLNDDFLRLNKNAYSMRYSDNLAPGFNIVIACREFLAELDHTFLTIAGRLQFGANQEPFKFTKLESFIKDQDGRLLSENHVLQKMDKKAIHLWCGTACLRVSNYAKSDAIRNDLLVGKAAEIRRIHAHRHFLNKGGMRASQKGFS